MEFVRRIYEDGKVTIPKELRELHGIKNGDFVKLSIVDVIARQGAENDSPSSAKPPKRN